VGEKMPRESCRRIMKGYEFHEPTTVGGQLFYISWCFFCGLNILGRRIWWWISEGLMGAN